MALSNDIFNVTRESFDFEDDIERLQDEWCSPNAPDNLNNGGTPITFNIIGTDKYYLPSSARLEIQGRMVKADGSAYANTDVVAFQNNGPLFLFSSVSYTLGNKLLETCTNVGWAVTMHKLLTDPHYKYLSTGLSQMSCKDSRLATDTSALTLANDAGFARRHDYIFDTGAIGTFSVTIPLSDIFGFADFYKKVIYNQPQTIIFNRAGNDNDAILRYATTDGKVVLSTMRIYMPSATPSIRYMESFKTYSQNNKMLPMPFRMRTCDVLPVPQSTTFTQTLNTQSGDGVPIFVVVGFQEDRLNQQLKNSGYFDNKSVTQAYVTLNGLSYPVTAFTANSEQYSYMYNDAASFAKKYYGKDELYPALDIVEWKKAYTLYVFDMSSQSTNYLPSGNNVTLNFTFATAAPVNFRAYVATYYDRIVEFPAGSVNGMFIKIGTK